ncbi:MAG TPA: YcxB family protein [Flavisolibacter sp.]|jgi:hypothetical protein|nr:YcxB family protein [Flavisolibacter sp.]
MIETNEFALTKKEYLKIIVFQRLRSSAWIFGMNVVLMIISINRFGKSPVSVFFTVYALLYPLLTFLYLVRWVNLKDNKNVYKPMQLSFGKDKLTASMGQSSVFETPTRSEIAYDTIIKKNKMKDFYLLFVAKNSFVVVPKNTFRSSEDREEFEKLFKFN